jgi:hypothetical protein
VFDTVVEVGAGLPSSLQDYVTRKNLPRTVLRAFAVVDPLAFGLVLGPWPL